MRYPLMRIYRAFWPILLGDFSGRRVEHEDEIPEKFPAEIASYSCPIINPPSQRHLFDNKIHNLDLALSRLHNLILGPGDIFSFWRLIGPPDENNGYREGATFIRQQVTSSIGGGLCQLSGVLYNLALLGGLRILERYPHSIDAYGDARYIPLGRDATVSHPRKDLCFQNTYSFEILLRLKVTPEEVRSQFFAKQSLGFDVAIEVSSPRVIPSPIQIKEDVSASEQEEKRQGLDGKKVRTWRVFHFPDGSLKKQHLSDDCYRATPTVVRRRPVSQLIRS